VEKFHRKIFVSNFETLQFGRVVRASQQLSSLFSGFIRNQRAVGFKKNISDYLRYY